jgi:carbon-monoxide dehydrogenase small subunit
MARATSESGTVGDPAAVRVELTVNGERRILHVDPKEFLLETLRRRLGLTGTKYGCGEGECGTCTVLLDGLPVCSCILLTAQLNGRTVLTIEGITPEKGLHPIQEAFVEAGAIQCGYCTPGMIMSAVALLRANPSPTRLEIRSALAGNLCRCTGYVKIVDAVELAARKLRERGGPE